MTSLFTQCTHALTLTHSHTHTHAHTHTHTHIYALTHAISQSQQPPNHLGLPNLEPLIIVWHLGRGNGHLVVWASGQLKSLSRPLHHLKLY